MSKAVVVLGAGASEDFGVPTLKRVFKDRQAKQYLQRNSFLMAKMQEIFWQPRGHTLETSDESLTVEEILTLLKDWENKVDLDPAPVLADVDKFRKGIYVLIKKAVYDLKNTDTGRHLNNLIKICNDKFEHTTWASFNWDCIFESSFWYCSAPRGGVRRNPSLAISLRDWHYSTSKHLFLKLHGAVNWWLINGVPTYIRFGQGGDLDAKWNAYDSNPTSTDSPIILEPSAYKYQDPLYESTLMPQWAAFYERMLEADCIVVVGYSFPEADVQARLKIMTAFQMNRSCRWLIIDSSDEVCKKYRRFMGESNVSILPMTLAAFNNQIRNNFQDAFPNIDFSDKLPTSGA